MSIPEKSREKTPLTGGASALFDAMRLDFNTIKMILLTACVVLALVAVPLFFVLRNFVTFDGLDRYFKVTESVRPKLLATISEVLDSGYSKNFIFDSTRPADNTMLFYVSAKQKVTLSVSAQSLGTFPATTVYLNTCPIETRTESFHLYEKDLTAKLDSCTPDEPNLHTLKIVLPNGLPQGTTMQMKCLILVSQRVHEHVQESLKK